MLRDHSTFPPGAAPLHREPTALERLGWGSSFASQIDAGALIETPPMRVLAVHRSGLEVAGDGIDETIPPRPEATVGDWLLLDRARPRSSHVLERKSLIKRRAPGTGRAVQTRPHRRLPRILRRGQIHPDERAPRHSGHRH